MSKDNNSKKLSVYFDTLGCAKNLVDTNKMSEMLRSYNITVVDNAKNAQIIVLNTCAFIEAATQESIDTFFEYRNTYHDKKIIVAGCLVSRYGNDLKAALKEADGFLSCKEEDDLINLVKSFNLGPDNNAQASNIRQAPYSYVKISEGCNRNCSYCMIPKIRGKYKSTSFEEIYDDVKKETDAGVSEIILVAQDCGVWGRDLEPKLSLKWLLEKLSDSFKDTNFRILYIQPDAIDNDLLSLISNRSNILNYLDIPLQHCSKKLLANMNRSGCTEDFLSKISQIRKVIPDCTLRTTFIVGFPGESDKDFDELCDFVQEASFDYAGCFEYSNEEGSSSFDLKDQVDDAVKYARANTLREILDTISINKLYDKIGQTYEVVIEGHEDNRYFGRAAFQAPEVDGYVFISEYTDAKKLRVGDKVNVKILDVESYDLVGSLV